MKNFSKLTWQNENLDRIYLCVPKGCKAEIRVHAEIHHENTSKFIKRAIRETRERDLENDRFERQLQEYIDETPLVIPIEEFRANVQENLEIAKALKVLETKVPEIREFYKSHIESQKARKNIRGIRQD